MPRSCAAPDDARLEGVFSQRRAGAGGVEDREAREALDRIADIIQVSDGAWWRAGPGVEMLPREVRPFSRAGAVWRKLHRPVIVATQMLESMIDCRGPRALRVTDVASAAFGHTDAVMLSGRDGVRAYPAEAGGDDDHALRLVEGMKEARLLRARRGLTTGYQVSSAVLARRRSYRVIFAGAVGCRPARGIRRVVEQ